MRIAPINNVNICKNSPLFTGINTASESAPILAGLNGDMFTRSKKVIQMPKDFGRSKFTIKDYKKVRGSQVREILKNGPKAVQAAVENVEMGIRLKKILDKKYGKNNYIFVPVGRSPAPIGRVLEFSGVEVKYIPASGLYHPCCYSYSEMASYFDFVLSKQGLTKEKAEENFKNSGKKVVVCDYTSSGASLKKAEKIMHDAGYESKFTDFLSLNKELENGSPELSTEKAATDYVCMLRDHKYKKFSGLPCVEMANCGSANGKHYDDLEDLKHCIVNCVPGKKAAYYNMAVMHLLQKARLLKENKANRVAL